LSLSLPRALAVSHTAPCPLTAPASAVDDPLPTCVRAGVPSWRPPSTSGPASRPQPLRAPSTSAASVLPARLLRLRHCFPHRGSRPVPPSQPTISSAPAVCVRLCLTAPAAEIPQHVCCVCAAGAVCCVCATASLTGVPALSRPHSPPLHLRVARCIPSSPRLRSQWQPQLAVLASTLSTRGSHPRPQPLPGPRRMAIATSLTVPPCPPYPTPSHVLSAPLPWHWAELYVVCPNQLQSSCQHAPRAAYAVSTRPIAINLEAAGANLPMCT